MKYLLILLLILTGGTMFLGCSSGYLYTNAPALEFADIDYGFPVKYLEGKPRLAYVEQGSGTETIILVHGLASNAGFWRFNIPELAKKYRVIALDLPGYGKSEKGDFPYTISFYAAQIKRVIDELKLQKVTLVGHSMGGQTAMVFSVNYPGVLNKLILAAPAGVEYFQPGEGEWLRNVLTYSVVKKTPEDGIRRNLANNFYTWRNDLEWMVEERTRMAKAKEIDEFCYAVVKSVGAMLDEPMAFRLKQVKERVLLVYGKYDGLIPNPYLNPGFTCDVFAKAKAEMPDCELLELDNTGHMLQIESPEAFNYAVLQFMAK